MVNKHYLLKWLYFECKNAVRKISLIIYLKNKYIYAPYYGLWQNYMNE